MKLSACFCANRNSSLRQPRNLFLINLAVTDFGLLLTNNVLHTVASFNKQWPFGKKGNYPLSNKCQIIDAPVASA